MSGNRRRWCRRRGCYKASRVPDVCPYCGEPRRQSLQSKATSATAGDATTKKKELS